MTTKRMTRSGWTVGGCALLVGLLGGFAPQTEAASATGGTVTNYMDAGGTNWTAHIFTTVGTTSLNVTAGGNVEVLVVGGGGGGGGSQYHGAGGGAGGLIFSNAYPLVLGSYEVRVGKGGDALVGNSTAAGNDGSNSWFGSLMAIGGGGGGNYSTNSGKGRTGGSGGGGSGNAPGNNPGGTNVAGQGFSGGKGYNGGNYGSGGGGGAGTNGADGISTAGGNGGDGLYFPAFANWGDPNNPGWFAGGGGGGTYNGGTSGLGGKGGGGSNTTTVGTDGRANTGGGGGGPRSHNSYVSGAGGSGIVIVRYVVYDPNAPTIWNQTATLVTTTSATLNGLLASTGSSACAVGVYWGTNANAWANTNWFNGGAVDSSWTNNTPFSTNIAGGLTPNTLYYYTYSASNGTTNVTAYVPGTFITGELTVRATDPAASEAGPDTGTFTIYRPTWSTGAALTVSYSLAGTAGNGVDYANLTGQATFSVGATGTTVTVLPIADGIPAEGPETVLLTLNGGGGIPGAPSNATVTIQDGVSGPNTDLVWQGSSNDFWSVGTNWVGNVAPGNPTANTPNFGNTDLGGTNIVDPETLAVPSTLWTVGGGLKYANTTAGTNTTVIGNGKTLLLNGPLYAWKDIGVDHAVYSGLGATITGGVLQVGAEGSPRDLRVAQVTGSGWRGLRGTLKIATSGGFAPYLNTVVVGSSDLVQHSARPCYGYLDLRGTPIVGGTLGAVNMTLGHAFGHIGYVYLDDGCNLQNFNIASNLSIGIQGAIGRIGNSTNSWKLQNGANVRLGIDTTTRGALTVGTAGINEWFNGGTTGDGQLLGGSNGTFTAYLNALTVGYSAYNFSTAIGNGVLDLSAMTNISMDVAGTVAIGESTTLNGRFTSIVKLPSGTVTAQALRLGVGGTGTRSALLELKGTRFVVNQTAMLGAVAIITNIISGKSAGLCLTNAADDALSIDVGGKIVVAFTADQAGGETGPYYGLAWKGDHVSALYTHESAGRLAWTNAVAGKTVGVLYDSGTGYTYVTIQAAWQPTAVARSFTRPVFSQTQEVVITAADMDGGSFDPNGRATISTNISCPSNLTTGQPYVTLAGTGAYAVTLTITNEDNVGASDVGTVTLTIPPATTNNLTWAGASVDGLQWLYGANWVGGTAPTNPTTGILSFDNPGLVDSATTTVTSIVTPKDYFGYVDTWSVSGLRMVNINAGSHNLQIPVGSTLCVTDHLYAWRDIGSDNAGYSSLSARFSGGTLQLGAVGKKADLSVAQVTGTGWRGIQGTLKIGTSGGFVPYLNTVVVGSSDRVNQDPRPCTGYLDLRGTPIVGGTLGAVNMTLGQAYGHVGYVYLDDGCTLQNFNVAGNLSIGVQGATGRIGNSTNSWKLQNGVNVKLGIDATTRGTLTIGTAGINQYSTGGTTGNGQLLGGSNGTFTAYLNALTVGYSTYNFSAAIGNGTLDLSAMTNALLGVAGTVTIGEATTTNGGYTATVRLPAGTAVANALRLGIGGSGVRSALLELNGTVVTVSNVSVGASGVISNRVGGVSSGLDIQIADTNAFAIAAGGRIALVFTADPVSSNDKHWGLRMAGDQRVLLNGYLASGLIATNTAGLSAGARSRFAVYYTGGRTSIGCQPAGGSSFVFR